MRKEEIDRLLERYYAGQTTEQEEDALLQTLRSANDLPADLQAERDLFLSLHKNMVEDVPVPEDLETELTARIDRKASAPRRRRLWWGSMAASILLLAGLGFGIAEMRQRLASHLHGNVAELERRDEAVGGFATGHYSS